MKIQACYAGVFSFFLMSVVSVGPVCAVTPATTDANAIPKSGIEVIKLVLAKDVKDHEPVDEITSARVNDVVVGWCQIRSGLGEVKVHQRWLLDGKTMADIELPIKSSPYRTWARKTLSDPGAWKLQVVNDAGDVLKEITFTVSQ